MATHSSILAWEIPWTEEPDGLQFMGQQIEQLILSFNDHTKVEKKEVKFIANV